MSIKSEWSLLEKIKETIENNQTVKNRSLIKGIGDDCAVYRKNSKTFSLFTTDISIEDHHFILTKTLPEDIAYKAMMGNISDIAAMAGNPLLAFISLGISEKLDENYVEKLYIGFKEVADKFGVIIAGGDLSKSDKLTISITLYGETDNPIYRDGAKTGDYIYVTGDLGLSIAGLDITLNNINLPQNMELDSKHNRPLARIDLIDTIINQFSPTAMIDISDGLLSDLRHICNSSNSGFILYEEKIPINKNAENYFIEKNCNPLKKALKSGEEYELLFTSEKKLSHSEISEIGIITDRCFTLSSNNIERKIKIEGHDHF